MSEESTLSRQQKLEAFLAAGTFYAACQSGHPFWTGPDRSTYAAAQSDATDHDSEVHGGQSTAVVLS